MEERRRATGNILIELFSEGNCSEFSKPGVVGIKYVQEGVGK